MTELGAALEEAAAFEHIETGFEVMTGTFDARVVTGATAVTVTVEVPSLDAVVDGEDVAEVVVDGWFDTFQRRLEGVTSVTPAEVDAPIVDRFSESIQVEVTVTPRPGNIAKDVLAVVNFIEGTWVGGIIPGYDYVDEIQEIRATAASRGGSDDPTPNRD